MVRSSLLLSLVSAQKLPCQRPAPRKKDSQPGARGWLETLPRKLKSSSRSAAADSCCSGRPYSSSTSQCCFSRIIPNEKKCCISGEVVDRALTCPCVPSGGWLQVERERLEVLTAALGKIDALIRQAAATNLEHKKMLETELGLNDVAAFQLGEELCGLLKLSVSDPECRNIETQIVENRLERAQRRVPRGVTIHEETVLDRIYEDYYGEYAAYSEEGSEYEGRLYDFAGRIEYELEPEEVQQREQEKIHYIVQKRKSLRADIQGGSAAILQAKNLAEQFKYLSGLLGSMESPLRESQYFVESFEQQASEQEQENNSTCSTSGWLSYTSQYLEKFKNLELLIDELEEKAGSSDLNGQGEWIADTYSELAYWHERKSRENNDYRDYLEEES